MRSTNKREMRFLLPVAFALLVSGCGNQAGTHAVKEREPAPVAVGTLVPVRTSGEAGGREVLLVPASSVFRNGDLAGVLVVGNDQRITRRWIRIGRIVKGDVVVLGGVDKGELVVGEYNPELGDGVTVIKSPKVTEEAESK
ncbi:efflux RND transporter periplasmic adaptor subunit [Chlorobium sp. KB01]|uniref:efflux RND transporter periplasmic adaptor subunit n=1 Tax=Chlorobium sp. KB01 TaxID=1917528 RepID=UPI0011872510|nr:efflux RND transporter periplasmic adaptor subunit [Chlorobium sp. KB01]